MKVSLKMADTDICVGSPTKKHMFNPPLGCFYDVASPQAPYAIASCKYCGYQRRIYPSDSTNIQPNSVDYSLNIDFIMRTK